jgi:hypothetical protein
MSTPAQGTDPLAVGDRVQHQPVSMYMEPSPLPWFVSWAGRYPVPLTPQEIVPKNMEHSGQVIPRLISVDDLKKAEGLAE